jgi:hypothetical protein
MVLSGSATNADTACARTVGVRIANAKTPCSQTLTNKPRLVFNMCVSLLQDGLSFSFCFQRGLHAIIFGFVTRTL